MHKNWRPRRSCLFVPGASARALEKAPSLGADAVIIDLEDAVAPEAKAAARAAAVQAIGSGAFAGADVLVRVNGAETPWARDDAAALAGLTLCGVVAPKVSSPSEALAYDDLLNEAGVEASAELWAMMETPLGVLNAAGIAACAPRTRLSALVLGLNDLAAATGMRDDGVRTPFHFAMAQTVTAARAYGLTAIDAVFNDFKDEAGLARALEQGRAFGFDGKSLIHPSQIAPANAAFAPSADEIAFANAVAGAFALPENAEKGVIQVEGRMVERLHLASAQRLLALAEAIAS